MASRKSPAGLGAGGARLWRSIADEFELDEHEKAVLLEASRTVDQLALLQLEVDRDGVTVSSPQGVKAHPALVELRQQRQTLARLLASLRVPEGGSSKRPQKRSGVRPLRSVTA